MCLLLNPLVLLDTCHFGKANSLEIPSAFSRGLNSTANRCRKVFWIFIPNTVVYDVPECFYSWGWQTLQVKKEFIDKLVRTSKRSCYHNKETPFVSKVHKRASSSHPYLGYMNYVMLLALVIKACSKIKISNLVMKKSKVRK